MSELLAIAAAAARTAAHLLREARPEAIRAKGNPKDLVTEWDTRSEEAIRAVLAERTPGIPVLGEEAGGPDATTATRRWIVDPIDGTVNFAHGLPIWCISIALANGNDIEVGVVYAPRLGWWFEAAAGQGAFDASGAPLRVSAIDQIDRALLATGFPYDMATNPDNNFAEWAHMQRVASACRRAGSAALDLCMVAAGWFDGYWERSTKAWDVAAGVLIVREAGGRVTNTRGEAFDLYAEDVLATNGAIHEGLVAELGRVRPTT
ncbi:MAG: inositol monophosphatase family protein [Kofleriaceae bacterium]